MQLTRTSDKLKRTILFNAKRRESPFAPPVDSGYFTLILIRSGEGSVAIHGRGGEAASFPVSAPTAICLRDGETLACSARHGEPWDVYNLVFSPTFINVNMRPAVMEQGVYEALAETYHLFRLAPFMETHAELKRIDMTEEQMEAYFRICDATVAAMEEEDPDKCWSCRIRAGLMDILTGLEAQYSHKIEGQKDSSLTFATYRNIVIRIYGDLMYPDRIEDVCRAFGVNKNKLQAIFYRYSGGSYHDFIKQARVERAQSYLAFTGLKLAEIAFRVGFSTEQHFYRFFKRETGEAPADFRRETVRGRKEAFARLSMAAAGDPGDLGDAGDPGCYTSRE